ncbi:hypothetical protein BO94DRAFT_325254 [Aspergillus sclerotioniger CBS 115572]|uniref:ER-bound oxygenase mpaB/mpaB'/Rubber oxygenase catalytic domain-containing protein n=1 Tax=Aspergillus sclerotioniger CBS 115572 TaxID=1450535 RepID=A0A317X6M4_9EURO|nr:hypothetical protein BO94DRAFT_325254 [Aspergillus sclerotioniger CBS 115572]PWY94219.1 hypothetical protein BO94DRAFT_325254 [Aspergillus sclerotioniger CBS 115572]
MVFGHAMLAVLVALVVITFRLLSHGKHLSVSRSSSSEENLGKLAPNDTQHIQKVLREGIILAGGAAAILLQLAMPGIGKAIDIHSNFSYRPLDRLRTTMTFIYCMAFGTPQEKRIVVDMVHRAHAPVKGAGYSADDVRLQLWVAASLYAIDISLYEDTFGWMDEAAAEAVYREYAVFATSLRVPVEMWPVNRKAFWAYWDQQIEQVEVTPEAKGVAHDMLYNKRLPLHMKILMPSVRLITAELLPQRVGEAYGLKRTRLGRVALGVMKATYSLIPTYIRTYPMAYYLKDMRRRIERRSDRR